MSENAESRVDPRTLLIELYWAAVSAADPGKALTSALTQDRAGLGGPVWIIALGKAAEGMTAAAVAHLSGRGQEPAGGIVVTQDPAASPHPALLSIAGDHPVPGPNSLTAADAIGEVARRVGPEDEVWVLLSGGATSLAAAPIQGISSGDLVSLYQLLLGSGLSIVEMNAVRKRFSRWSAGQLAAALHSAAVWSFVVSDVIGDDLPSIGSGPCVPDELMAEDIRRLLEEKSLWERIPRSMRDHLRAAADDPSLETPKADHPAFRLVQTRIVAANSLALGAALDRAAQQRIAGRIVNNAMSGEAQGVGRELARTLLAEAGPGRERTPACLIWGGETVVSMTSAQAALGGRCQELALAAAGVLAEAGESPLQPTLLAAGTDGRDGPTDAAGAVVDSDTWEAIRQAGRNPERDLAAHNSYSSLDSVGGLLRTGPTGTNVMDIVIGIVGIPSSEL